MFEMPNAVKITGRSSTITNSFVNSIIPVVWPTDEEIVEALAVLGMDLDHVVCAYCGDPASEWDHLRPLVNDKRPTGYISEIANLVPACGKCNQSKGGKPWRQWMLGPAKRSPASRQIQDLRTRVLRLEEYEAWRVPARVDFESVAGESLWSEHWSNHAALMQLMKECQVTADEIRDRVAAVSEGDSRRRARETASVASIDDAVIATMAPYAEARMNKARAASLAGIPVKGAHFANVNSAKDVWWVDVPLSRLAAQDSVDLLLFHAGRAQLAHLRVPSVYMTANEPRLNVRSDKQCIRLELRAEPPNLFMSVVPAEGRVQFASFLVATFGLDEDGAARSA